MTWKQRIGVGIAAAAILATGYCYEHQKHVKQEYVHARQSAPAIPDYKEIVPEINYAHAPQLANPDVPGDVRQSLIGRIQRAKRFDSLYKVVEHRYGEPKGTLAAVVMQESYGNPVMPNKKGDGGLGLVHFQASTAKIYGLRTYGPSTGRPKDHVNGRAIKEMLEDCHYGVPCIAQYDDRAHLLRNIDAAGRLIKRGKEKFGNWNQGIRTMNWYGKNYVPSVLLERKAYLDPAMQKAAADDFERRNPGMSFEKYIKDNNERMVNWGLKEYEANKMKTSQNRSHKQTHKHRHHRR